MSPAARISSFGSAGGLVIAGVLCGVLLGGSVGQILTMVLVGLGLVLATGLVFLEVGLSEDRQRSREEQQRGGAERPRKRPLPRRRLIRPDLGRSRDHPRRLR